MRKILNKKQNKTFNKIFTKLIFNSVSNQFIEKNDTIKVILVYNQLKDKIRCTYIMRNTNIGKKITIKAIN